MVPEGFDVARAFPGVADSKKLSEKKRAAIYTMLEERAARGDIRFTVELEDAEMIDRAGIEPAVRRALARGVDKLVECETQTLTSLCKSDFHILLDGSLKAPIEYAQETIIGGDALVPIISLASIAAKVARDRLMLALAKEYPAYGFERHKGYGTRLHYDMLLKHGLSVIHRRSFVHLAD